ncbi:MAG: fused MFS/spermidine synthase [Pseudomonadota bacterium]
MTQTLALQATRSLPFGRRQWFLATIFTSAFLLFMVQPMVARMALPRVGGAPSVWNSAMLVYQALLLAGYAYAHALGRLSPRVQARVHVGLLIAAALTLPLGLLDWSPAADSNGFVWVPWLFLASIGPLFFVVSAHAPLLQRWYALSGCGDPYPLYAASNFGSFLGLLAYPLLVEPFIPVGAQSIGWSWAFALLALLVVGSAARLPIDRAQIARATGPTPSWRRMGYWALLAAVPSGLIMSTTLHLTTDIVAMPLLWVMPLGLYLLSFSLAFAERRNGAATAGRLAPIVLLICACGVAVDSVAYPFLLMAAALAGLFLISVSLHSRLFDDRPEAGHLTLFYLVMSIGGALGGLFSALIAPQLFDWTYEHPILLMAAAMLLPMTSPFARLAGIYSSSGGLRVARLLVLLGVAAILVGTIVPGADLPALLALVVIGVAAIGRRFAYLVAVAGIMLVAGGVEKLALSATPGKMTRSYFGIYALREGPNGSRQLVHGTTTHGVQNLGSPERERMLTTYFARKSGVGQAMLAKQQLFPGARVAVVGLGAGTLACYARPGEQWKFYEIDPAIVTIAEDSRRFTFLSKCLPGVETKVGDARLTLAADAPGSVDMLVIDAFSSDSVPMHLLTREAFRLYRRKLAPGGLLMVHISNRYLDLLPVVAGATDDGWLAASRLYLPNAVERRENARGSLWVALSDDAATLDALQRAAGPDQWQPLVAQPGFAPWTDDRSSILPLIKWRG